MSEKSNTREFLQWMSLKLKLRKIDKFPIFRDGDIWWVSVGENIGVEINGKSSSFSRPVLILKKLSNAGFMGIPLTTQIHSGSWYVKFKFQDRQVCTAIAQARLFSAARLSSQIGQSSKGDMLKIKKAFSRLYVGR